MAPLCWTEQRAARTKGASYYLTIALRVAGRAGPRLSAEASKRRVRASAKSGDPASRAGSV